MSSVSQLKKQAAARDSKAKKEMATVTKNKKVNHSADCLTKHDTNFMARGATVGQGGSHWERSATSSPTPQSSSASKSSSPKFSFTSSSSSSTKANFCSSCGSKASGAFCSNCGTKL